MSDNQVIFSMVRVGRTYQPGNKQVLRDISLGFYYGAKIGVLGLNGAGKSTLLRIIAGRDDGYSGEVAFSPGYSVGLLEQEPELDSQKTVRQVVEEAVQGVVDLLKRYDAVGEAFAEPDAVALVGSAMYPRYYAAGDGIPHGGADGSGHGDGQTADA